MGVELDGMEKRLHNVTKEYEKLKVVLAQKQNAKKVRQNTSTTFEMINNPNSSTRYHRRHETKKCSRLHSWWGGSIVVWCLGLFIIICVRKPNGEFF